MVKITTGMSRRQPSRVCGRTNREIADALSIGEEIVKTHVLHVLSKLMVENRAQAIVQALKRGLVTLDELD